MKFRKITRNCLQFGGIYVGEGIDDEELQGCAADLTICDHPEREQFQEYKLML